MTALRPNGGAAGATIAYDTAGRRSGITRANGVSTVYGYDGVGRLQSLSHDLFGSAYDYAASWTYNPADQVAKATKMVSL